MKRGFIIGLLFLAMGVATKADLPEVPLEVTDELGINMGKPQRDGFVFINGRYLAPPYTVTRRGNGIYINRIQAEQPLPWPPVEYIPFEDDGANLAAGDDGGLKDNENLGELGTLEDLFGDDEDDQEAPAPAPVPEPQQPPRQPGLTTKPQLNIDPLFLDDGDGYTSPGVYRPPLVITTPTPAKPKYIAVPTTKSGAELEAERQHTVEQLDKLRLAYERALARGDFFFFGASYARVNGNKGAARELIGVLPGALRHATSPQELQQRLIQGGITFLSPTLCGDLFKHKNTFPLLEQRLKRIEEGELIERMKRENALRPSW